MVRNIKREKKEKDKREKEGERYIKMYRERQNKSIMREKEERN